MSKSLKISLWVILAVIVGIIIFFVQAHTVVAPNPEPVTSAPIVSNFSQVYTDKTLGFTLHLPDGYSAGESYTYQELGPGKDISGVKFTIPASVAAGTNLSSESYISVENIPNATNCSASLFLDSGAKISTVTDNGVTYSKGVLNGAAAGNRYDETVYAIPGTNPCLAIRYFIHYGVIDNYPAGMVKQFDEAALVSQFDQIRETLVVNR